jgi:hypothetical protein
LAVLGGFFHAYPHFCIFYGLTKVLEFGIVGFSFFERFSLLFCESLGRVL